MRLEREERGRVGLLREEQRVREKGEEQKGEGERGLIKG